jgi:6-pyruvoyltetrahydropterin/6-carboxytetrahydropterin synthase
MTTVTVKASFSAAKRLTKYEGKCRNLHGYRHTVEASFTGTEKDGIVLDFYKAKNALHKWLDENWDHNVLLNASDKALGEAISAHTGQKVFYLNDEPTAENLAKYLIREIMPKLVSEASCCKIRLYDDENAFVEVTSMLELG